MYYMLRNLVLITLLSVALLFLAKNFPPTEDPYITQIVIPLIVSTLASILSAALLKKSAQKGFSTTIIELTNRVSEQKGKLEEIQKKAPITKQDIKNLKRQTTFLQETLSQLQKRLSND